MHARSYVFILLHFYYVIIHIRRGLWKVCAVRNTKYSWQNGTRCRDGMNVLFPSCLSGF